MKKKMFMIIFTLLLSLVIVGCSSKAANTSKEIKDILTNAGYVLEARDSESMAYYQASILENSYGITATVKELYVGYINQSERWVELIVLANEEQAESYAQALNSESESGKLLLINGPVILITYSAETINLFPKEYME